MKERTRHQEPTRARDGGDGDGPPHAEGRAARSLLGGLARAHGQTLFIFVVACIVFAQSGWERFLQRDDALYIYSGRQLLAGVPPYVSALDVKGPLSLVITAPGIFVAHVFGWDDIVTVRFFFLLLSASTVVGVFLLGKKLLSTTGGLLAAALFVTFRGFGLIALSGSNPKTFVTLLQVFALLCIASRRWFVAGLLSAMAALTWQPTVYIFATALVLCVATSGAEPRRAALGRLVGGALIPVAATVLYFALEGALTPLVQGAVELPLVYAGRAAGPVGDRLLQPIKQIVEDYGPTSAAIFTGWLLLPVMLATRFRSRRGLRGFLSDPAAGLFVSALFALGWSFVDYQNYPDAFPLLTYAAIGAAWGVDAPLRSLRFGRAPLRATGVALLIGLLLFAVVQYRGEADHLLTSQHKLAEMIKSRWIETGRVAALNTPEALVMLNGTNPNRLVAVYPPTRQWLADKEPGGVRAMLQSISRYNPDVVVVRPQPWVNQRVIRKWLRRNFFFIPVPTWEIYVPKERLQTAAP